MLITTGLAMTPPVRTYRCIASCSGLALKGIDVAGGVIDPDYEGEVKIIPCNNTSEPFEVKEGDRVAQLICEFFEPATS